MAAPNPISSPGQTGPATPTYQYPFLARPSAERFDLLAEQLHRLLAGGDPSRDSPYHRTELRLVCVQAFELLEAERVRKNKEIRQAQELLQLKVNKDLYLDALKERFDMDGSADYYVRPFVLPVKLDPATEQPYLLLPDDYVSLTRYERLPGEGILEITAVKLSQRRTRLFVPFDGAQASLFQGLLDGGLQGNVGYAQESGRVVFYEPLADTELLARLVIRTDMQNLLGEAAEYEPTTNLAILSQALQVVRQRTPTEDLSNDQNDAR